MMLFHLNRLVFPLIVSNILHMVAIKRNWLPGLNIPINEARFGANKTWRGFVLLPLFNGIAVLIFTFGAPGPAALIPGMILGMVYLLFELPNSYLKRRMGIGAGEQSQRHRLLFMLLDKTDSAFGVSLAYYLLTDISLLYAAVLFVICSGAHILFSLLLVWMGVKRSF